MSDDQDQEAAAEVQNAISPAWNNGHGMVAVATLRRLGMRMPYDPVTDAEVERALVEYARVARQGPQHQTGMDLMRAAIKAARENK